uniref:Uncharacterized protein n=1 Tax=Acrobeloides nanus TaxID=290746 RepID=A0A914DM24_9BILA
MWSNELARLVQLELKKKQINASPEDIKPLDMTLLYTEDKALCKKLVVDAIENIDYFLDQLKPVFLFTIIAEQQQSYKNLDITGRMVAKTAIFSKLDNLADKDGNTYLSSNDLNDLSQEVINDVIVSVKQSSDYIPDAEEESIIKQLTSSLTEAKVQAKQLSDNQWDSVFWDDMFSRPDIQTQYFNDVITFNKNTNEFKYNNESDRKFRHDIKSKYDDIRFNERTGGGGFSFGGFGLNANGGSKVGTTKHNESSVSNNTRNEGIH